MDIATVVDEFIDEEDLEVKKLLRISLKISIRFNFFCNFLITRLKELDFLKFIICHVKKY